MQAPALSSWVKYWEGKVEMVSTHLGQTLHHQQGLFLILADKAPGQKRADQTKVLADK